MRSSPRWRGPPHKQDFKPCWTEAFTNQETWKVVLAITLDGSAWLTWPRRQIVDKRRHAGRGINVSVIGSQHAGRSRHAPQQVRGVDEREQRRRSRAGRLQSRMVLRLAVVRKQHAIAVWGGALLELARGPHDGVNMTSPE